MMKMNNGQGNDSVYFSISEVRGIISKLKHVVISDIKKQYKKEQSLSSIARRFLNWKSYEYILQDAIPKGRKYKVIRKMARLFNMERKVDNYRLARCVMPVVRNQRGTYIKFRKKDYDAKKSYYDTKLKNHFKVARKYWKRIGYTVRFHGEYSCVVSLKSYTIGKQN